MKCGSPVVEDRLSFIVHPSAVDRESFAGSVCAGLSALDKSLSCAWFYDERGSELFEQICALPEYYLTRSERAILELQAGEIASLFPTPVTMVELGSGSSAKTRLLIRAFHDQQPDLTYCPIDISPGILHASAQELLEQFPRLSVRALAAEYLHGLQATIHATRAPRVILFLGSSIGNFEPAQARKLLCRIRQGMDTDDRILLGFDIRKSGDIIEPAYNDSAGVTAAFNKNLLARINRGLGGNFDLNSFDHHAPYVEERGRVEMRLVSRRRQDVAIQALDRSFHFEPGEFIHTENSHKYSEGEVGEIAGSVDLSVREVWRDSRGWFALMLLAPL